MAKNFLFNCFARVGGRLWVCLLACLMAFASPAIGQAHPVSPSEVDSLLEAYGKADQPLRTAMARKLIDRCMADDPLTRDRKPNLNERTSHDSIDLAVWYAAERYYFNHAYFAEAIALIDRALPLTQHGRAETRATLLCDKGYCLYKTGNNTEAVDAEMEAERLAKQKELLLPLARAYNYLAIINLSLNSIDEAKHFVKKALQTDRESGSNLNTHNYLGIACEVYNVAKVPDSAIMYGRQAVEAARNIGYAEGVVNHLAQLSYAYNRKGDYEAGLRMAREAVSTVEQMPVIDRNLLAISLEYVAYNLLDMKRNAEAVPIVRRAIALQQEVGNTRSVCYDYKSLAEALEPDSPRVAMAALRRYSSMMDSIHYAQMHEVLGQANAQLHNDELQTANADSHRRNRQILLMALGIGALLLAVIGVLLYINRLRERTNQAMRQLQNTREQFFTNITHEFRTPLTVIQGLSRQLQDAGHAADTATVASEAAIIEQQGKQLLTLVNQLLDISKVKLAIGMARWVHGDVMPQLTMMAENFAHMAKMGGIKFSYKHDKIVEMDYVADYMQKIVGNLVGNALKHTPEGGHIEVTATAEGDALRLSVCNTGQPIAPDVLPHIFEPFYQASDGDMANGTGIGLALTEQLVLAMKGTIGAVSSEAEGTRFSVRLPLRQTDIADIKPAEEGMADEVLDSSNGADVGIDDSIRLTDSGDDDTSRQRVLVVEDNKAVAYYVGKVLSQEGYEVCYAADGTDGMAKARTLVPDIIVTDLMMPHTDGLELCRQLRSDELTSHVPVIVITALAADGDRVKGLEAGADAYLTKPFEEEVLKVRVKKLLEQRRLLREKFSQQMSAKEPTEPQAPAAEVLPTTLDQQFLEKVDAIIVELMPKGEADLEHVSTQLFMHPSTFRRKLVALTGTPPAQYIMRRRMEQACLILADYPNVTIADVAERCGFSDSAHFTHVFRRFYNTTPLQWVKTERNIGS